MKVWLLLFSFFLVSHSCYSQNKKNFQSASDKSVINNNGPVQIGDKYIFDNASNKTPNDSLLNRVKLLFARNESQYKVLLFPFKQQTHIDGCTKDYAQEVYDQLTELNRKENLNIAVGWLTEDYQISPYFTTDSFKSIANSLKADFILYGNYDSNCMSDSGQVCVKYISTSFVNQRSDDDAERTENIKSKVSDVDFSKGSLISDVKGLLYQVKAERYFKNHMSDSLFLYYSQKALENNKGLCNLCLDRVEFASNPQNKLYSYNLFLRDVQCVCGALPKLVKGEERAFVLFYTIIGEAFTNYGLFDSAFYYFNAIQNFNTCCPSFYYGDFMHSILKTNRDSIIPKLPACCYWNYYSISVEYYVYCYYEAIMAIHKRHYLEASKILDSCEQFNEAFCDLRPESRMVCSLYSFNLLQAFLKIKAGNFSSAVYYLENCDIESMGEDIYTKKEDIASSEHESQIGNYIYLINNSYSLKDKLILHYLSGALYYKLKYFLATKLGDFSDAYNWCNYYIDTTDNYLQHNQNRNVEGWEEYPPHSIVKISCEDYYDRALLEYRLNLFDEAIIDAQKSLFVNPNFNSAYTLLKILRKGGGDYARQKRLDKRKQELPFSFEEWTW